MPADLDVYYRHDPLGPGQFRLFELEPQQWKDELPRGRLLTFDLDSKQIPDFTVISYLWNYLNSNNERKLIECGGKPLQTPPNLNLALSSVLDHETSQPQLLWIDAVCINQSDDREKGSQLVMMPRIMSMAKLVVLYVNKESESTRSALQMARSLISARKTAFRGSRSFPWTTGSKNVGPGPKAVEKYRSLLPPSSSPGWKAINDLLDERAFSR